MDSRSNWPLLYEDKTLAKGQYYNSLLPRTITNAYPGGDMVVLKQTMLEHEYIFKHQVFELHRLYRIQRDMMDEIKRKELYKHRIPLETSSSSSPLVSQMLSEDARKWHKHNLPLVNSVSSKPSASGAEIISSPLSCTKGSTQASRIPYQNGCTSKDCEILESRPSKVRKKLFDLQLPADEYIDSEEGEQSLDNKISDISSYPPSRNHKIATDSSVKLNPGGSAKINSDIDASGSGSCLRNSVGLADLNEPIQVEEVTFHASVDFIGHSSCHAEIKDLDLAAKPKLHFLANFPKEILPNSQHGSNNGTSNNLRVENKGNGRDWLSYTYDAGYSKTHLNSFPQGLQPDKLLMSSQPMHTMNDKVHQPLGIPLTDPSRGDLWRDKTVCGGELSERSRDTPSLNHLGPIVDSRMSNPYPLVPAFDFSSSWSHSASTWGKPNGSLTQKISIQTHPPLNSLGNLSRVQSSAHSHEIFKDKWHLNGSSGSRPSFGSGLPNCNGFYHGSSSASKDIPTYFSSAGFDNFSCNTDDKVASELSMNHGPRSYLKGSNFIDMKPAKDLNLNVVLSKCSSNEVVLQEVVEIIDEERKCEDHLEVFPWLKAKPGSKNDGTGTRKGSCDREAGSKRNDVGNCLANGKILGFPIFDIACTPKNESSLVSTSSSLRDPQDEGTKNEGKIGVIDINLACDPETGAQIAAEVVVVERGMDNELNNFRAHIDLNSCVSEEEVTPSVASTSASVKIALEIDLEVPAVPETEEDILPLEDQKHYEMSLKSPQHKVEQPQDEAVRIAAETIVAISSSGHLDHLEETTCPTFEAPSADPLLWFVEVVSSYVYDLDSKINTESRGRDGGNNEASSSDEIDYFEVMTLNLSEIKEEEYMPMPLVPENQTLEETGTTSLPNRPRKGQSRRGRPRRDFQRDILPGLVSLSRHEVTEDLQTFGGLMRATGHPWHSGLTRRNGTRNGGARGRRRLVVDPAPAVITSTVCTPVLPLVEQLNNIEVGLEDRSLTGWGKTPRRPRRQRCPPGNLPSIPLT